MQKPYAQILIEANEENRIPPEILIYCLLVSPDKNLFIKEIRYEESLLGATVNILTVISSLPAHRKNLDILYEAEHTVGQYFPGIEFGLEIQKENSISLNPPSGFDSYLSVKLGR